jgi:hypothetical protein
MEIAMNVVKMLCLAALAASMLVAAGIAPAQAKPSGCRMKTVCQNAVPALPPPGNGQPQLKPHLGGPGSGLTQVCKKILACSQWQ